MMATLLTGGTVVELDPAQIGARDLVMIGDRIGDPTARISTTSAIDCSRCLIIPGLVVAHTHLYSALARGMPPPPGPTPTFRAILEQIWWRLDRAIDARVLLASAKVGALEAARAGVTTLIDHHESPSFIDGSLDVVARGVTEIGLRSVLTYGATDRHGAGAAKAGLAESERFAKKTAADPLVRGMIGLHAPFTCSDDTLDAAGALARSTGAGLHLHAAEGPDDQAAARARWNKPLFSALDERGLITPRTVLAHAVDLGVEEAALLAARRPWITHQARSNMNNGVGYAGRLLELERVALGTDGIDNDALAELRAAFFRAREHTGPAVFRDPVTALARGHRLAAELFGAPDLGRLVPGAPADVVVLAYDPPSPLDPGNLAGHLLFGGLTSLTVRDVFVGGRAVIRERRPVGLDAAALAVEARQEAAALFARLP
ncbi:MAG: amidohydrolase family protein [Deltaproteobacteria bacterium]|nr:amidohydrolase family protein [Deltaproteobacteria bacterium]